MISITDHHAPRLLLMHPARIEPLIRDEVEAGAQLIVDEAVFSIIDGAVSGSAHVASLPGESPNANSPNWAPAFAGVVEVVGKCTPTLLFSREGGSPVWVPAFAGKQCATRYRRGP